MTKPKANPKRAGRKPKAAKDSCVTVTFSLYREDISALEFLVKLNQSSKSETLRSLIRDSYVYHSKDT